MLASGSDDVMASGSIDDSRRCDSLVDSDTFDGCESFDEAGRLRHHPCCHGSSQGKLRTGVSGLSAKPVAGALAALMATRVRGAARVPGWARIAGALAMLPVAAAAPTTGSTFDGNRFCFGVAVGFLLAVLMGTIAVLLYFMDHRQPPPVITTTVHAPAVTDGASVVRPTSTAAADGEPAPEPNVTSLDAPLLGAASTGPSLRSSRQLLSTEAAPIVVTAPIVILDNTWTGDALREECRKRGLSVSGLKSELIQRLNHGLSRRLG